MNTVTKVLLGITGVALASVLVVNATGTAKVISSAAGAYNSALSAAEKG